MRRIRNGLCALVVVSLLTSCGDGSGGGPDPLNVAWTFPDGDCAANGVETVRVTVTQGGSTTSDGEFACSDGSGDLGAVGEGSYGVKVEGLDADGNVVAENYGDSITLGPEGAFTPVDVTLHPKAANVVVSWHLQGGGTCPTGVQLPYYVAIYNPPANPGDDLTDKVMEVQEGCASGQATLQNVNPGDYVVEVDSRAVTPAVRGTSPVTVEAGMDAEVTVEMQ